MSDETIIGWAHYRDGKLLGFIAGPNDPRDVHDPGPRSEFVPLVRFADGKGVRATTGENHLDLLRSAHAIVDAIACMTSDDSIWSMKVHREDAPGLPFPGDCDWMWLTLAAATLRHRIKRAITQREDG